MSVTLLQLVLLLISLLHLTHAQTPFTYTGFQSCPSTPAARYDISTLSCTACLTTQISSFSSIESCQCQGGYSMVASTDSDTNDFTCSSCITQGFASLRDGSACIACDSSNTLGLNSQTGDCVCPSGGSGYLLVERDETGQLLSNGKQCLACPNNSLPNPTDRYTCNTCPDPLMTVVSNQCTCPSGYTLATTGTVCVAQSQVTGISTYPASVAAVITYQDVTSHDGSAITTSTVSASVPFTAYYTQAAVDCKYNTDRQQCQLLGHLCVLQMYTQSSPACGLFNTITNSIATPAHGFATTTLGWKTGLPFLYYSESSSELTATDLLQQVNLGDSNAADLSTVGIMAYQLATYTLNGTFLGFAPLTTQLQLCPYNTGSGSQYLRFGVNYENSCSVDLSALLSTTNSTLFYTLFVIDTNSKIYPVPVKILNYRNNNGQLANVVGTTVNTAEENMDASSVVLTSRFFLLDVDSGRTTANSQTTMLVYAQSVTLRVSMQEGSDANIYPPLLVIAYAERSTALIEAGGDAQYSALIFTASYLKDSSTLRTAAIALLVVSLVFAVLCCGRNVALWHLQEHHPHPQHPAPIIISLPFITRILVSIYTSFCSFLLVVLTILSFYAFLFYKAEQTAYFLLPATSDETVTMFGALMVVCWVGKMMSVIGAYWKQITVEMVMIDWENHKHARNTQPAPVLHNTLTQTDDQLSTTTSNMPSIHTTLHHSQVSVWRKLFTANKWNDLQYKRTISISTTLICTVALLRGLNLQNLASAQPTLTIDNPTSPIHPVLLFAVTTFFMCCLMCIQYLYKRYIVYHYYKHPILQFLDFLHLSNISVLIFTHTSHAFYLHGKSVFASADVTAEQLVIHLQQEALNQTKQRGLFAAHTDMNAIHRQTQQQHIHSSSSGGGSSSSSDDSQGEVFSVYLSHTLRAHYEVQFAELLRTYLMHQHKLKIKQNRQQKHIQQNSGTGNNIAEQRRALRNGKQNNKQLPMDPNPRQPAQDEEAETVLVTQQLLSGSVALNDFLIHFFDGETPDFPKEFAPKEVPWFRRILGLPAVPAVVRTDQQVTVLCPLLPTGFTSVLPMGVEFDNNLLQIIFFNLLLFYFGGNTLVAAVGCLALDQLLWAVRGYFGQLNISRKTLIDQRFLF